MDYDSIPAGREMDALVSEKVMGIPKEMWHSECRFHKTDDLGIGVYEGEVDDSGWCYSCAEAVGLGVKTPDRYSTSTAAALEVVEKLENDNVIDGVFLNKGRCEMYKDREQISSSDGKTPLAICRAALKAVSP